MRARTWCAAAAALVLVGCGSAAPKEPPFSAPPPPAIPTEELVAAKKAAKIADCPTSDAAVATAPSGLPDITLGCLGGGRDVRLAGLRGRPMLVNIWAQWCGPCREEAPYLAEVANGNRSDLVILGVDYDDPRPDRAIEFARVLKWRFPQAVDADRVLAGPLQLTGPPVTLLVRADGTVAYRHSGPFRSAGQIRSEVQQHLGVSLWG